MSYPHDPGWPPPSGQQGPWQQPTPPGGPQQPPGGPGPGYGPPPGTPQGGYQGGPGAPYPPPATGRPPGGGGNVGLILIIIFVCVAILVVVGGVGLWLLGSSGGSGASGEEGASGDGGTGASGSALDPYIGTWDGALDQFDSSGGSMGTWSATIEIADETIAAEEYGLSGGEDGRCAWEIEEAQISDSSMAFSYTVTDDPDCADNGDVTLEPVGEDSLDIEVTSILSDGTESDSEGSLDRQ